MVPCYRMLEVAVTVFCGCGSDVMDLRWDKKNKMPKDSLTLKY